jgi:hypothetical protein
MEWQIEQSDEFEIERSPCSSAFAQFVTNDINNRWLVNGWEVMIRDVRVSHKMVHWHSRLQDVLQKWMPLYDESQNTDVIPEEIFFLVHNWSGRFVPDTN